MNSLLPSLIRTYVPLGVAWLAGFLLTIGVSVTSEERAQLASLFGAVVGALYYLVVRLLERRYPWATALLGSSVQPAKYAPAAINTPPAAAPIPAPAPPQPPGG